MEFTVNSAELLKGIVNVSRAIPAKTSNPILENFLFIVKGENLEVTASDMELTLRTNIPLVSVKEEGSTAVPARQLIELFKTLPDQPVVMKSSGESSFECEWNSGNSSLPAFPAGDYPEIKGISAGAGKITTTAAVLAEGIGSTVYATADDEIRPAMNGIFFDITPDSTTLVASDSHKLICYTTKDIKAAEAASFILHKKAAIILKSTLDKETEDVTIEFDATNAMFTYEGTMMFCRLVVGKYPKYRDVIPQNNSNILKIDRQMLLGIVRRVAVCANRASNYIKFELKPGQLEITAQDPGFAIAAYEKAACDYAGEALAIGFKSSFLMEILSNMSCDNVVMKFADSRRAALIVPSEEEAEAEKMCGIIMPLMVS